MYGDENRNRLAEIYGGHSVHRGGCGSVVSRFKVRTWTCASFYNRLGCQSCRRSAVMQARIEIQQKDLKKVLGDTAYNFDYSRYTVCFDIGDKQADV